MAVKTALSPRAVTEQSRERLWDAVTLLALTALATALRVYGLAWGLPDASKVHSYHPDEITVLAPTLAMNLFAGEMNPHFFNYGSLFLYAVYFARLIAEGYGWLDLTPLLRALSQAGWLGVALSPTALHEFAKLHLFARGLTVACGVATVWLVFFWARRVYGRGAATLAAFLLASFPLHVQHSHFATVDVPLALLTTLALYLAVTAEDNGRRMAMASFVAGLATAVKYSVAPALWLTLLLLWTWRISFRLRLRRLVALTALMAAGFLLSCPYAVLDFPSFWRDFYWETFVHSRIGHGYVFANTGNGHWFHLSVNLPAAIGLPALAAALLGGIAVALGAIGNPNGLVRRTAVVTLVFALAYFVPLGFAQVRFARYLMPLLPVAALWAGALWAMLAQRPGKLVAIGRWLWRMALIAVALFTFLCGIATAHLFAPPDPRDATAEWFRAFAEKWRTQTSERMAGAEQLIVALHDLPWFYTPPICPLNGGKKTESAFWSWQMTAPVRFVFIGDSLDDLLRGRPPPLIASDCEYS
ncbi:MAG: hypothetical protein PVTTEEND_002217, partial [Candidatus Fervidibacter sp.]